MIGDLWFVGFREFEEDDGYEWEDMDDEEGSDDRSFVGFLLDGGDLFVFGLS